MSRNLKSREGSVSKALFIVAKKDGNQRPVINLKQLNQFVPYQMEFTKRGIQKQVRFEGCSFLCSIKQKIQEICKISSVLYRASTTGIHNIVENSCGFASLIRLSIYLDDMLVFGRTMEIALMSCQSVIHILQFLGFVINLNKSLVTTVQKFLGMIVNTTEMNLSLQNKKWEI